MKKVVLSICGALGLMLGATHGTFASGETPNGAHFICDTGDPYIQVVIPVNDPGRGATLMIESEQMEMAVMPVASGYGYDLVVGGNFWILRGKGMGGPTLTLNENPPMQCWSADNGSPAQSGGSGSVVSEFGNFSLGGKVRSGPGTQYGQVGSLPYGTPVVLVSNSNVNMDGYYWFEIEYAGGKRGYQWGGVMCSNGLHVLGLYDPCPADLSN